MARVPTIRIASALDVVGAALLALAGTIAITGGFTAEIAGVRAGLHDSTRVVIVAAVVLGIRLWRPGASASGVTRETHAMTLARVVLAATALTSIGYWIAYLTTVSGGADSYGYVSASELILQGALIEPQAISTWLPVTDPLGVASPAAYVPAADGSGIAPIYPLGFPAMMAVATLIVGSIGPYLLPPLCGVVCVVLAWRLAMLWYGPLAGWLAATLVAWEPLVVTYAKQPMSDVPATMWALLAVWWMHEPHARPFAAGMATGLSFVTRPGGLGTLAVIALRAVDPRGGWRRTAGFAAGAVPFVVLQAWLQWHLYGGPLRSGYGSVATLFSGGSILENLGIYATGLWRAHSWIWFAGIAAAGLSSRRAPLGFGLATLTAGAAPYLLYFRFDHWETLRFLLPAVVLLTIVSAGGVVDVLTRATRSPSRAVPVLAALAAVVMAASTERFLRAEGVPGLREAEARYRRVAERIERLTPGTAVVLAMQHSGSLRHYANRTTLRWDVLRPEEFERAVAAVVGKGLTLYVVLEGAEQRQFEARFADALTRVLRLPVTQVGNVQIWQLEPSSAPPP
jgi:hypothetical protein